jgi:hypothetical protein
MPARTRKLKINDKDKSALELPEDDFRRHWVSAREWDPRNAHPGVAFNQQDNGFEHLKLEVTPSVDTKITDQPELTNFGPEEKTKYLAILRDKLSLAKDYVIKEKDLSLDPDRIGMRQEKTSVLLAEPPIIIGICTQQMTRLLIDKAAELRRLNDDTPDEDHDAVLDQPMREYLLFWDRLKSNLVWQLPGEDEEDRMKEAERIMDEVLEKLVEA